MHLKVYVCSEIPTTATAGKKHSEGLHCSVCFWTAAPVVGSVVGASSALQLHALLRERGCQQVKDLCLAPY